MIIYRPMGSLVPHYLMADSHWQAEYWDDKVESGSPIGLAWITVMPSIVCIDYVLVADQHRRRGIGMALIQECRTRWPNLILTDAISVEGQHLLDTAEKECLK